MGIKKRKSVFKHLHPNTSNCNRLLSTIKIRTYAVIIDLGRYYDFIKSVR
jgi:hypothetical protein